MAKDHIPQKCNLGHWFKRVTLWCLHILLMLDMFVLSTYKYHFPMLLLHCEILALITVTATGFLILPHIFWALQCKVCSSVLVVELYSLAASGPSIFQSDFPPVIILTLKTTCCVSPPNRPPLESRKTKQRKMKRQFCGVNLINSWSIHD